MPETTVRNRRRAKRTSVSKSIALVVDSARDQIANGAFALDLSTLGARIRTDLKLEPGQLVTVIPKEGSTRAVPSRVVWVGESGSQRAGEAGIAFLEPTTLK